MSLRELQQMLRQGPVPSLVLLHGEESYFLEKAVRLILDAVVPPDARDFNYTLIHGRDCKASEVFELVRTYPVFAERRLVLVKGLEQANAEQLEPLVDYVDNPVAETVLLLTAGKIDARRKLFQRLRKNGRVFEFKKIYENQLPAQVRDIAADVGLTLTGEALKLFCMRVGTSLAEVEGELRKLASYGGERTLVEAGDVLAVVSDSRVESVFALVEAIGRGQADESLRLLHRLVADGEAPLKILAMIVRHFRQLWRARCLSAQRLPAADMARQVGVSPYFLKGLVDQAHRFEESRFPTLFERLLETDLALKSSGAEPLAHLEQLVLRLVRQDL
ncbi:MAG: DNA polymerase III subunit delta [Desulfuromonadales bacterium]|nr:DNA polymerase III subunit delta [Desulfuromonadales bacterium]